MKCPECQFKNREGAKFCNECGHKFEVICPECKVSNRVGSKFCDECGHGLAGTQTRHPKELSFDEKLTKVEKYLPKGLTEKILSQRDRIEGERKQVTVMFCDMEGFTSMVELLGAEDAYNIMDQVYELLIHKVHAYDGTVNEMTGDGIMALFGAPIALEDAPQRAIRSAYAIQREMSKFNDKLRKEKQGVPFLKMRVGIHSGPVIVGTLGNNLRVEFKAVGDTVNIASRMEGLAEPGTIYVTGDTFKLTEGYFRFEALGDKRVKGKETPVDTYRVIAPSSRKTRFDVNAERGLTSFVGRSREMDLLLDSLERAKGGTGQAFSVIGEAGIGKSRFLYEFRKIISNEDITFLEGKCLSYGKGVPYHPITDILKGNFEIGEKDSDDVIREKVKSGLEALGTDQGATLPYLLELLGVRDSGIEGIQMSPEGRKDRIIEAVKQIILKGAQIRPLVIAIEDLHWADQSTEDALKWLLEAIPGANVLIVLTYRPEFVHTWEGRSYHNQITLNRLSNRESLFMLPFIFDADTVDTELQKLVLSKTEGVPFFIEEFVKSLKDLEVIKKEDDRVFFQGDPDAMAMPTTIQDIIMTRVDRLSEDTKTVLQVSSAIEREFSHNLISEVMGLPEEELLAHFSALKDAELLYERGIFPQSSYIFRHALTREVVYDSILASRRRELHQQIGSTIEEINKNDLVDHYEILSEHFYQSKDFVKAADYSKKAAKKAEKTASLKDAITYTKKRVESIQRLPATDTVEKQLIDTRTILGLYTSFLNQYNDAKKAIEPIFDLAIKHDLKKRISQIYVVLGSYDQFVKEDYDKAKYDLDKAIKTSELIGDFVSFALANYWIGCLFAWNCEFEKSYFHINKSLEINETVNNLWGIAAMKSTIGIVNYWNGMIDYSYKISNEALQAAEGSGDLFSKALSHTAHGISCFSKGYLEPAINYLLKATDFCRRVENPFWEAMSQFNLGDVYFETGNYQTSWNYYKKAVVTLEKHKLMPSFSNLCKISSVRAKVRNNGKEIDLDPFYHSYEKNKGRIFDGWISRYIVDILLYIDDQRFVEAENWLDKAIEADSNNKMQWHLGRDYALYADFHKRAGEENKAKEKLGKAIDILERSGADGWVDKYRQQMEELS